MTKRIVRELSEVFGKDTILANENGSQDLWSYYFPYYKVLNTGCCLGMPEQTCFGMGVVGAIAAKLTRPDLKVVCTDRRYCLPVRYEGSPHCSAIWRGGDLDCSQ